MTAIAKGREIASNIQKAGVPISTAPGGTAPMAPIRTNTTTP